MLALVLLALLALASAQSCGPVNISSIPVCSLYYSGTAYADATLSATYSNVFRAIRQLGTLSAAHTGASRTCVDLATRYLCLSALPACSVQSGSVVYQQPCSSVCSEFYAAPNCSSSLTTVLRTTLNISATAAAGLMPACNQVNSASSQLAGQPLYGDAQWNVGGGSTYTATCVAPAALAHTSASFDCYLPYLPTSPNAPDGPNGYCEQICPRILSIQIDRQALFVQIITWIIWPLALVAMIIRLTVARFSKYPANLVLLMLFGWFFAMLFQATTMVPDWRASVCTQNKVAGTATNPVRCGVCAFGRTCGLLIFNITWAVIAVHSAVAVILQRPVFGRISMIISYLLCIGLPFLLTIMVVASNNIVPLNSNPWCFPRGAPSGWVYSVWYAPLGLSILIGTPALVIVFIWMLRAPSSSSTWALKSNLRLVCFLLLGFWYVGWAFGYHYGSGFANPGVQGWPGGNSLLEGFNAAYTFWLGCSIYFPNCPRGGADGGGPGAILNDGAVWAYTVSIYGIGLAVTILFLAQKDLWTNWDERVMPWIGLTLSVQTAADEGTASTAGSSSSGSGSDSAGTFVSDLQ